MVNFDMKTYLNKLEQEREAQNEADLDKLE